MCIHMIYLLWFSPQFPVIRCIRTVVYSFIPRAGKMFSQAMLHGRCLTEQIQEPTRILQFGMKPSYFQDSAGIKSLPFQMAAKLYGGD